jgi:hypothetical protein
MPTKEDLFRAILLLIIVNSVTSCISASNQQAVMTPFLAPTSSTLEIVETATPSPTAIANLTVTPTTLATQTIPIESLTTATMIRLEKWSPDGRIFAYWTFDGEQLLDFSYPPGTLHFLNAQSGDVCSYPHPVTYTGHVSLVWQPDGKVAVLSSDPPRLGTPCKNDFAIITDITSVSTDLPDPSLSPNGSYQAITRVLDAPSYTAETSILSTHTGETENTIDWRYQDTIGSPVGGQWLTNDQFLINETLDQGPLLITVGKGITQVAPEIFGKPFECGQHCYTVSRGAPISGTNKYHLALFGTGEVSNFPPFQLYHSESNEIEEIPFRQGGFFSPNGKWIIFYDELVDTQESQQFQIWLRPVDPVNGSVNLLATTDVSPFPLAWSPDSTKLAVPSSMGITIFVLSNGSLLGAWDTGDYKSIEILWSPDNQVLALRGDLPLPGSQEALFLVHIP